MNKRNLQKELDTVIENNRADGRRPRLLLHICCGPCSSYCIEYLSSYFDVTEYYSNSNIDDEEEYYKRLEEAKRLPEEMGLDIGWAEGVYAPDRYHELVKGHEKDPEGGARCAICFAMRLRDAAQYAAANGYDFFTTSLSISPLKDAQLLCEIGEAAGREAGVRYLPSDFKKRDGYKRSVELSAQYHMYRQNYCGCSYSASNKEEINNG